MTHLLVTNDFPPKVGGIQSYLYELWRRLPSESFAVLTHRHPGDRAFDAAQPFRIERRDEPLLLPTPSLRRAIVKLAAEVGATLVVFDPVLPVGWLGPQLELPYAVVLHGAEVTVPARLPASRKLVARVISRARLIVAGGSYPSLEAKRLVGAGMPETVLVEPGVDAGRFSPLGADGRRAARRSLGLDGDGPLVVSVGRLVPRKGMDVLIESAAALAPEHPGLIVAIAGGGRDATRLERLAARTKAPVRFLGRLPDDRLPALLGAADLFVGLSRTRWLGLEQEGFGMVFLEAAAAGVACVAGLSGGSYEAVAHGETGLLVDRPGDAAVAARVIGELLADPTRRQAFGAAGRRRALERFDYGQLSARLAAALSAAEGAGPPG